MFDKCGGNSHDNAQCNFSIDLAKIPLILKDASAFGLTFVLFCFLIHRKSIKAFNFYET